MNQTFISLSSLSMDLKRVALGYHNGSITTANRFLEEALKRKNEIDLEKVDSYIRDLLDKVELLTKEKDTEKIAEDALMYSTLFQNASMNLHKRV